MQALFWILAFLLFYTYVGYGLLLLIYTAIFRRKMIVNQSFQPAVTFIVPAYNEEEIIGEKIQNTLSLHYPPDKIFFVFVTDGSTDSTPQIVRSFSQITLLHQAVRNGKSAAINRAMQMVKTPLVVFSDANTMLHPDSVLLLARHYTDPRIGGVSGEKRISDQTSSTVSFGERLYWKYESLLKKANSAFYTIVGAAGELVSIRTSLFKPLPEDIILDDFVTSANVCLQGYRFLYERTAYGIETSSASMSEERKRKVRISAGCYQALVRLKGLLNPFKNLRLSFQYISHRVLRWVVCPVALPLLFITNFLLYKNEDGVFQILFWAQCFFYLLALLGWAVASKRWMLKPLLLPYYFLFMILSQYQGFYRFIRKKQPAFWEKAARQSTLIKART